MEIIVTSLEESIKLGEKLGTVLHPGMLITLSGDLGAGKTTFTKGIALGLGVQQIVNSPTFTILKQYTGNYQLSHFDAYRLEGQEDDLGFEEIFESDDVCVVEWANFIEDILPEERLEIIIKKIDETSRCFVLKAIGQRYHEVCKELER
ncbi:tRNA (adenosine(37)-N6)-threonylcarbamoyltransferase complex ATPase subunit type 1 TsaE [Tannockella kyphosi]|uniref:tRNA (adenosine(37)-N6)-threonylcarbamoyltransferase complex ATPase subunit type 1 TsaE n=1 Tax=Tannockella kyphosi TaxID=2899121 RepID=UPI0020139F49|nr:tRNA (adenosine(37)-N6)-threonylcarbamoyltransferase complex ATPase subunit type 1 TsaE [Tannockella kyphosi]